VDEFALDMSATVGGVSASTFNADPSYTLAFMLAIEETLYDPFNPENEYDVSNVKATDAASTPRRKLRELAASDSVVMTWTVTATGNTVSMDDTNAQMISSVNSGDFDGNLALYAAIAGAPALQTASMEGLESVETPPAAKDPAEASSQKSSSSSKVALIAGVAGGAAVLVLGVGYVLWTKSANAVKPGTVVPATD
jgi:hypothetical protein